MESKLQQNKTQKTNFTQVPNEILNSDELSWGAKGLWAYIAGKPEGWKFTIHLMARQSKDGVDATTSRVNELLKAGYLKREIVMTKNGKECFYSIYEKPNLEKPNLEKPNLEKPNLEKPILEYSNTNISNKEKSNKEISNKEHKFVSNETKDTSQNSTTQLKEDLVTRPTSGQQDQVNGNASLEGGNLNFEVETNEAIREPSREENSKEKSSAKKKGITKEQLEVEFEEIWQYCPYKEGKADGKKYYIKVRRKGVAKETILEGMKKYAEMVKRKGTQKKYIIRGGNWFKGERWEDEIEQEQMGERMGEKEGVSALEW